MASFVLNFNFVLLFIWSICVPFHQVLALDNGLVLTPPMGWLQWARFTCEVDCNKYPESCINEQLFRTMANILSREYRSYGYEYINIDDCWSEKNRDSSTNELLPDFTRFPHGIKSLASFVHSKNLKLGIYGDIGTKTCQYYPGFQDTNNSKIFYFDQDSKQFASWGIDFLKVDGCYGPVQDYDQLYPELGTALNKTDHPIVYSCSWPAYQVDSKMPVNYSSIAQNCNLWRNYGDIEFSWESVTSIIDYYGDNQAEFSKYNGPGQWFDPDMIIVGNNGLSIEQQQAQFALWSMWSAPLLMSNDLRIISKEAKKILTNRHVIAIDQDAYGLFGQRVYKKSDMEVWLKPCDPREINENEHWSYAIVYFNRATLGIPRIFSMKVIDILLPKEGTFTWSKDFEHIKKQSKDIEYQVLDLLDDGKQIDVVDLNKNLTLEVDVGGAVRMVKLFPIQADKANIV